MQQASADPIPAFPLWLSDDIYHGRYEKSASALVAVRKALQRNLPLKGQEGEFLRLYDAVVQASPELFTWVWKDPTAYLWVRVAYELLATCLSGAALMPLTETYCREIGAVDPAEALRCHLHRFKGFVLALNYLAGTDCHFETPYCVSLPFALPGTSLSLSGGATVAIAALVKGRLEISSYRGRSYLALADRARDPVTNISVAACPLIQHQDAEIRLQPYTFNQPGLPASSAAVSIGLDFQWRHMDLIHKALAVMAHYQPQIFAQFSDIMQVIALKPRTVGDFTNVSHSDMPGAFIASLIQEPFELAETFIHEFHHNRLFALEETGAFFDDTVQDAHTDCRFYSPWRGDPRPLHGLFHALYVFIPVCKYWQQVHNDRGLADELRTYALSQLLKTTLQLAIVTGELKQHAHFTGYGEQMFAELQAEVHDLNGRLQDLPAATEVTALICNEDGSVRAETGSQTDQPLSVAQSVRFHIQQFHSHHPNIPVPD